jgi:hemerythrin-like domain-containing protein
MLNILGRAPDQGFDEPLGLLTDCHRRIESFLEVLMRVAREYAGRPLDDRGAEAVATARRYFLHAAPRHTADEEESLFPRLRAAAAARGEPCPAVAGLEADHERADGLHSRVDGLLDAWLRDRTLPAGRSAELRSLLDTLRELYREHIGVEERDVFPLAGRVLSAAELSEVGSEMRGRRGLVAGP